MVVRANAKAPAIKGNALRLYLGKAAAAELDYEMAPGQVPGGEAELRAVPLS